MTHVAIIGAGPAGIATAIALADRDIRATILERGTEPLAALRTIDPEIRLLTPERFSRLGDMPPISGDDYPTFGALVTAIDRWRSARGIAIVPNTTVSAIARDDRRDGFVVHHTGGELVASHVVNATGIIGSPVTPPHALACRAIHSTTVRSAELATARRLVVVGAGMSAAETLERWLEVRSPGARAWISSRGPIHAIAPKLLGIDVHWFLWGPDHLPGRVFGHRIGPKRDLIIGRAIARALRDGTIEQTRSIELHDPDLVVFATGYRYGGDHLGDLVARDRDGWPIVDRHSASTRAANLFVLGARFGRTVASGRLAGIARDAVHVARRIAST